MSYDILYRTLAIRDGNNLILLEEVGPSNCFYGNTRKRIRDWHLVRLDAKPITSVSMFVAAVQDMHKCTDYKEYLKYRGRFISKLQYLNLLERVVSHALTPEQAMKKGITSISIENKQYNPIYEDVLTSRHTVFSTKDSTPKLFDVEMLITALCNAKVRAQQCFNAEVSQIAVPKEKKPAKDYAFIIQDAHGMYAARIKRHMLHFVYHKCNAKQFSTKESATNYITRCNLEGCKILKIRKEDWTVLEELT